MNRSTSIYKVLVATDDANATLDRMIANFPKRVEGTAAYVKQGWAAVYFRVADDDAAREVALAIGEEGATHLRTGYGLHEREVEL